MSRRREQGDGDRLGRRVRRRFAHRRSPAIAVRDHPLGDLVLWMVAADLIYAATLGPQPPASLGNSPTT